MTGVNGDDMAADYACQGTGVLSCVCPTRAALYLEEVSPMLPTGASPQSICLNILFGAPHTGHLSGASPSTVLPHTWQT